MEVRESSGVMLKRGGVKEGDRVMLKRGGDKRGWQSHVIEEWG